MEGRNGKGGIARKGWEWRVGKGGMGREEWDEKGGMEQLRLEWRD